MARRMVLLAVELPEPFFVPTMIEKSLITLSMRLLNVFVSILSGAGACRAQSKDNRLHARGCHERFDCGGKHASAQRGHVVYAL
jgi:hypothetical protein